MNAISPPRHAGRKSRGWRHIGGVADGVVRRIGFQAIRFHLGRAAVSGGRKALTHFREADAIRPQLGFESTEYIAPMAGGGLLKPAWYKIIWPPDLLSEVNVQAPPPPHDPNETVEVVMAMAHKNQVHVALILDASGNEIDEPRIVNDAYRANQGELPDPATLELRDFSAIMEKCR